MHAAGTVPAPAPHRVRLPAIAQGVTINGWFRCRF